ncbi:MBL fold metallo-hydrolase [Dethiothermospora halolimnae]|uniref:MBL fold metallo-hydrolase n=1 Tax=Dethiothermospora halolimnae TaxID=3114390 RepID=UPI003CCBF521
MYIRKKAGLSLVFIFILSLFLVAGCDGVISEQDVVGESLPKENFDLDSIDGKLAVHFIDVGQADSILVQLPNGENSLIDGGNRGDGDLIIDYIKNLNIRKIDYLIGTHPHEDHIGGLPNIVKNFEIGKIYLPKKSANTKIYKSLLTEIKKKGLKVTTGKGGIDILKRENLVYSILAPNSKEYDETNEYSIVNKLTYKNNSFIFTGDAEKESENEMLKLGYDLKSDVLKVGHHGGKTSTNKEFLKKVDPKYAIISSEKDNSYGHPHKEVLNRLNNRNIKLYRTDKMGTIVVTSDGNNLEFNKAPETNKETKKADSINIKGNTKETKKYIGNKNSKVYHSPSCGSLPNKENQILLKSEQEAKEQGFRPHKICVE